MFLLLENFSFPFDIGVVASLGIGCIAAADGRYTGFSTSDEGGIWWNAPEDDAIDVSNDNDKFNAPSGIIPQFLGRLCSCAKETNASAGKKGSKTHFWLFLT